MTLRERLNAIIRLEARLQSMQPADLSELFGRANSQNAWFTPDQLKLAREGILKMLNPTALQAWVEGYSPQPPIVKRVGVVMAGNIPAVGFHDFLCVLISGHRLVAKLSSQDAVLIKFLAAELVKIEPRFHEFIYFEERLNGMDAVIATGSDNTARYFEYYFRDIPHIIRKNRSSCAILLGEENAEEFKALGQDVFSYFGLGCRSISKLYIPDNFALPDLLKHWEVFNAIANHHKYANNYDYNKSIYLINQIPFLDTGFVLLTESEALVSPISVVFYERYQTQAELAKKLDVHRDKLQCITSARGWYPGSVAFGQAQYPGLTDYADDVDVLKFLTAI